MRLGEIIFLISMSLSTFILLISPRERPFLLVVFPFSMPVIFLLHLIFENTRWQMIPAYIFAGIIILINIIQLKKRKKEVKIFFQNKRRNHKFTVAFSFLILLVLIVLPPIVFPVFTLPETTGSYPVGTTWLTFLDTTRFEKLTGEPDDFRKLALKIWYPSESFKKETMETYWNYPEIFSKFMANHYNLPSFLFKHLGMIKTNSRIDSGISGTQDQYPVILFLHGGECTDYVTDLRGIIEDLASHGYIIIGLTHPYSSPPIIFRDSERATCSPEREEILNQQNKLSKALWATYFTQPDSKKEDLLQKIFDIETIKLSEIEVRMNDVFSVLSWINNVNSGRINNFLTGKCNTDMIGILGIDMGGSVAVRVLINDERVKACVNIDGFHYVDSDNYKVTKPYMLLTSEASKLHTLHFIKKQMDNSSYLFTIKGSTRQSFKDFSLFSPVIDLFHINGKTGYKRTINISRNLIKTFYEIQFSKKEPALLIDLSDQFKEIIRTSF